MTSIPDKDVLYGAEIISDLLEGKLEHHGIKGMRWGVRRFQNKDGSLTPAGKKRYGGAGAERDSTRETTKPSSVSSGTKKLSEMTDEELRSRLARLDMEKRYLDYMRHARPEAVSAANRLIEGIALESLKTASRSLITAALKSILDSHK